MLTLSPSLCSCPALLTVVTFSKSFMRTGFASVSLMVLRYMETRPILPVLFARRSASMRAVVVFLSPRSTEDKSGVAISSVVGGTDAAKVPS